LRTDRHVPGLAEEVRENGYAVHARFLSEERVDTLRDAATALTTSAHAHHYPKSTRVWDLYRHGTPFTDLLQEADLTSTLTDLLGEHHLLSDYSLNTINPEQPADDWHIDYPYNEMPTPVAGSTLGVQCILTLDAFYPQNGATRFVPGSHHRPRTPDSALADAEHETFTAGPGALLVMAAATWHRSGINHTTQPRAAILLSFVERWVRPMTDPPEPGPWATTDTMRILLGIQRPTQTINDIPI
jgi:ectoine hydroxylase-related dioxygenase (phytanoyl-CoA dioxygenase family)